MKAIIIAVALFFVTSAVAMAQDVCAPAKVTTVATTTYYGSIDVTWTETGDDCTTGNPLSFDVRYMTTQITDTNWQSAASIIGDCLPNGNQNHCCISAPCPGIHTYYVAVFLIDDAGNRSPLSNVVTGSNRCSAPFTVCN